ncbi:hypothetical protein OXX59_009072 [Metschnikowia pulcherrima]
MPPPMLGIKELLNDCSPPEQASDASDDASGFSSHVGSEPKLEVNTSNHRIDKLFRSRVHPALLRNRKLLDIALRRKSAPKRASSAANCGSKLHRKSLEAGLRVRLISAPSIYEIYYQLMPLTAQSKQLYRVVADVSQRSLMAQDVTAEMHAARQSAIHGTRSLMGSIKGQSFHGSGPSPYAGGPMGGQYEPQLSTEPPPTGFLQPGKLVGKTVRLIDNNLVNLAGVPLKVLKSLTYDKSVNEQGQSVSDDPEEMVRTFNNLDTAVSSLFSAKEYSLIRVTKSAASNSEGSSLVKLETAKPGDPELIDDGEFIEDMVASLGEPNMSPSNLFIKKVVARPRYKVDMKLYFVPSNEPMSLYVDPRSLERDLINGIIDLESIPDRHICATFDPTPVLNTVRALVQESRRFPENFEGSVPNHITENLHKYFLGSSNDPDSEGSSASSSTPASRSSLFSSSNNSVSSSVSGCSSVLGK